MTPELSLGEPTSLLPAGATELGLVAKFIRALGEPARLRLLEYLLTGEHTVTECVAQARISQGRVSSHLACLAACGFVVVRQEGRYRYYRITDPRVADLVRLAGTLTAENARGLAACTRVDSAPSAMIYQRGMSAS